MISDEQVGPRPSTTADADAWADANERQADAAAEAANLVPRPTYWRADSPPSPYAVMLNTLRSHEGRRVGGVFTDSDTGAEIRFDTPKGKPAQEVAEAFIGHVQDAEMALQIFEGMRVLPTTHGHGGRWLPWQAFEALKHMARADAIQRAAPYLSSPGAASDPRLLAARRRLEALRRRVVQALALLPHAAEPPGATKEARMERSIVEAMIEEYRALFGWQRVWLDHGPAVYCRTVTSDQLESKTGVVRRTRQALRSAGRVPDSGIASAIQKRVRARLNADVNAIRRVWDEGFLRYDEKRLDLERLAYARELVAEVEKNHRAITAAIKRPKRKETPSTRRGFVFSSKAPEY